MLSVNHPPSSGPATEEIAKTPPMMPLDQLRAVVPGAVGGQDLLGEVRWPDPEDGALFCCRSS